MPWTNDIRYNDADDERKSGDDFKIDQRFAAYFPYFFQITHAANANTNREEDQWIDEQLDNVDEVFAQGFHFHSGIWREMPQQSTT
jgi:hypothetical protein